MPTQTSLQINPDVESKYQDIYTPQVKAALEALASFDGDRKTLMRQRSERRAVRAREQRRITFLDPNATIGRTNLTVRDARAGKFSGGEIPIDLQRQWIQGTGPATKPHSTIEKSIRNVAYALLSGADGWMFDGEDALGQVETMSLDNQRNLKLAIARDPLFLKVAEDVAVEMNTWAQRFFGRPIVDDWRRQLDFTTVIFRARGLHLDDRHIKATPPSGLGGDPEAADGSGFTAAITDLALYVVHTQETLRSRGRSDESPEFPS